MIKVAIACGGTGGHIYPGIATAQKLQDMDLKNQILFIGSEEGLERKILSAERFSFAAIKVRRMLRKLSWRSILAPLVAISAVFSAVRVLRAFKPDILFTTGGYAALPAAFAAKLLGIPVITHEQNVTPGLSNRLIGFVAKKITVSFDETLRYFPKRKTIVCGNPVRKKIAGAMRSVAVQKLGLDQKRKTLLILGGSQGAKKINEIFVEAFDDLCAMGIQIVHVTGDRDFEFVSSRTQNRVVDIEKEVPFVKAKKRMVTVAKFKQYHLMPYMLNIWDGLAAADLVVSRAGGTAIAEILSLRIPSILIPFPYSANGHQDRNAELLKAKGAARVLYESALTKESLLSIVKSTLEDRNLLYSMSESAKALSKADASDRIGNLIYDVLKISREPQTRKKAKPKRVKGTTA